MSFKLNLQAAALAASLLLPLVAASPAHAQAAAERDLVDVGESVPDADTVFLGLFPEAACEEVVKAGFKCMGFRPVPARFSLPAASFKLGSAELPEGLKKQLDVFAQVLKRQSGDSKPIVVEGHADASGQAEANLALSLRRAESVRDYLVRQGVPAALVSVSGAGAARPKNPGDPFAAENRRVEIGRVAPPS